MKSAPRIAALFILTSQLNAWAQEPCFPGTEAIDPANLAEIAAVMKSLPTEAPIWEKEMAADVRTLSRGIDTYSWTSREKLKVPASGPVDAKQLNDKGLSYVDANLGYYNNMTKDTTNSLGPGLYLASDPAATAFYSGFDSWAVLKVPFKSGERFLDFRDLSAKPFSAKAQEAMKKAGCDATTAVGLMQTAKCRPLLLEAQKDLRFSSIAYTYTTSQFLGFPERPATCFVLASKDGIDQAGFRTLIADTSSPDPDRFDRDMISESMHRTFPLMQDTSEINGKTYTGTQLDEAFRPWKNTPALPSSQFDSYAKVHFLGMSNYPEDAVALSARSLSDRFSAIQASAKAIGQSKGVTIDPLRFRFLIQSYYPPRAADHPTQDDMTSFAWASHELPPLGQADVDAAWNAGSKIRKAAIQSAEAKQPLTLAVLRSWDPDGATSSPVDPNLKRDLEQLEKNLHDPTQTHDDAMSLAYQMLDDLNMSGNFLSGRATLGQALIQYIQIRTGLPPTFLENSWTRVNDTRYRDTTSSTYNKMSACLSRWQNESTAALRRTECGIVGN